MWHRNFDSPIKNHVGNEKVVGVDVDIEMLKKAEMHTSDISYVEASAETLPFEENTFALVTAFGAFHWFANTESLTEIFRVLKPEGSFCIINKQNRFKDDLKKIVTEYGGVTLPDIKEKYAPASLLAEFGVSGVEERVFTMDDPYTPEEARGYYTSLSFSNYVPADKKESTEEKVMEYFLSITNQEGIIEGTTNITVVLAGGKEFMV